MRSAISTLGWDHSLDPQAADAMLRAGISGVEIAPSRRFRDPLSASKAELLAYRSWWESQGFVVEAIQSLVFGRPDLLLFGDPGSRQLLQEHLKGMCRVAEVLGAGVLVFGAPSNRARR
ncbi:MAG: sugar phosphate isomerase/epimerase, partial [Chloroflexota bacterium]